MEPINSFTSKTYVKIINEWTYYLINFHFKTNSWKSQRKSVEFHVCWWIIKFCTFTFIYTLIFGRANELLSFCMLHSIPSWSIKSLIMNSLFIIRRKTTSSKEKSFCEFFWWETNAKNLHYFNRRFPYVGE